MNTFNKTEKKKKPNILGIVLIIIGIILIIGALSSGSDDPEKVSGEKETLSTGESTEETTEAKPFTVGDTVEYADVYVTLDNFKEMEAANGIAPEEGNTFVLCEFIIDNQSDEEIAVSSLLSFEAYADDYAANLSLTATALSDGQQLDGSVAAGKKMRGVIGFEIPEDWSEFEVRYSTAIGSKQIIFIIEK